jgi:uncharacterized protein (TIGR02646 family)
MRLLDRGNEPDCLKKFNGVSKWTDVTQQDKLEIWAHLEQMQGKFCAYCECSINDKNRHIEHFRKKENFPKLTFEWINLFGSCDNKNRCGHFKDRKKTTYNPDDIIKPDRKSIGNCLSFAIDGTVKVKKNGLPECESKIAETLRVFNLADDSDLKSKRRDVLERLQRQLTDILQGIGEHDDAMRSYIDLWFVNELNSSPFREATRGYFDK